MKTVAKISVALACLAILIAGAYLVTSRLGVESVVTVMPAEGASELISAAREKGLDLPENIEDYYVITLELALNSYSPFKAQWIDLSLRGGDEKAVVLTSNAWLKEMDAFGKVKGENKLYISFLSQSSSKARQARLDYYIFGRYHTIDIRTEG